MVSFFFFFFGEYDWRADRLGYAGLKLKDVQGDTVTCTLQLRSLDQAPSQPTQPNTGAAQPHPASTSPSPPPAPVRSPSRQPITHRPPPTILVIGLLLQCPAERNAPRLCWSVGEPPGKALLEVQSEGGKEVRQVGDEDLQERAVLPRGAVVHIHVGHGMERPWGPVVVRASDGEKITVGDVLGAVYRYLQGELAAEDLGWSRSQGIEPKGSKEGSNALMRRVDALDKRTRWCGERLIFTSESKSLTLCVF